MVQFNKKTLLLFIIIFVHVSILDLFFVTLNGAVFLWEENSQLLTIATHLTIAVMVTLLYVAISMFRIKYQQGISQNWDKVWWLSSLLMFAIIAIILI
ncbi:MAG: hypothetical protein ACI9LM_002727 [Alteromonadaceae bacterium]|jgi:hypothetical protein